METLYKRLGGTEGVTSIVGDIVDRWHANPKLTDRFPDSDIAKLKNLVASFFIVWTGGPNPEKCKEVLFLADRGMNITDGQFNAMLDEVLAALDSNDIGRREKEEVLYVLYRMRKDIVKPL